MELNKSLKNKKDYNDYNKQLNSKLKEDDGEYVNIKDSNFNKSYITNQKNYIKKN